MVISDRVLGEIDIEPGSSLSAITIAAARVRPVAVILNLRKNGGETGIRTLGPREGTTVFETAPFDHSGTSPRGVRARLKRIEQGRKGGIRAFGGNFQF